MQWSNEVAEDLISGWRRSGWSVARFCRERGLSRSTFDHWRRKLRAAEAEPRFVELEVRGPGALDARAVGFRCVRTPDGFVIGLGRSASVEEVALVVERLRGTPCSR